MRRLLFALAVFGAPALVSAAPITIEFTVDTTSKIDFSTFKYVEFEPLMGQKVTVTFDDAVTARSSYTGDNTINRHAESIFGSPTVVSPLEHVTSVNPLDAPVESWGTVQMGAYYSGEPAYYWEQFTIGAGAGSFKPSPLSSQVEYWDRSVIIYKPELVGAYSNEDLESYALGSNDIREYLQSMWDTGASFQFNERYYYSIQPDLLTSGYRWEGVATITNIIWSQNDNEIPEPGILGLLAAGVLIPSTRRR